MSETKRQRILSGIQPTGTFTLGNYIGAVRNWAALQDQFDCLYMVADLHALTVRQVPAELRAHTREAASMLLAAGIDPSRSILFVQSHVPAHTQLNWILCCNSQFGELSRMTQFKDKSAKHPDNVNGGLFTYPALMAADILIYNADLVPVGQDQSQHLELARNIAQRFNQRYGEFFTLPELVKAFDISGISKSPAVFDIQKLRWMNAEYMKKLSPEAFFEKAEPYLRAAIQNPAIDLKAVAALVQPRCEVLTDLAERVDFLDKLPEYDTALYVHKKSKTTLENSLETLKTLLPVLREQEDWSNAGLYERLVALAAEKEVKNSIILWPLRVAVSGKASTPGGATELCALLGKDESLARIERGIAMLSQAQ